MGAGDQNYPVFLTVIVCKDEFLPENLPYSREMRGGNEPSGQEKSEIFQSHEVLYPDQLPYQ